MDEIPEILELDAGFDLENACPDVVSESLGLKELSDKELFSLLQKGASGALIVLQDFDNRDIEIYYDIGRRYAPVCYEIYIRLFRKNNEPRLPVRCITNRYRTCNSHPDSIVFWNHPDLIISLFESLEKDGFYASS